MTAFGGSHSNPQLCWGLLIVTVTPPRMIPEQVGVAHIGLKHVHTLGPRHVPHLKHRGAAARRAGQEAARGRAPKSVTRGMIVAKGASAGAVRSNGRTGGHTAGA
jgi:hypothetical protein